MHDRRAEHKRAPKRVLPCEEGPPRRSRRLLLRRTLRELTHSKPRPGPARSPGAPATAALELTGGLSPDQLGWRGCWGQLSEECDAQGVGEAWVRNHYRWVVWKLACEQRCFPDALGARGPAPAAVVAQLRHRLAREARGDKSALLRVLEGELPPGTHQVLCVASADSRGALELTDGWYSTWFKCDAPLMRQLAAGRLRVGLKLRVCGCTLASGASPGSPLSLPCAADAPQLQLHANSTRRAAWDAQLGQQRRPAFRIALSSVQPDGGRLPCVQLRVVRVYGPLLFSRTGGYSSRAAFEALQQQAADETPGGSHRDGADADEDPAPTGAHQSEHAAAWTERDPGEARHVWRLLAVDTSAGAAPTGADFCEAAMWGGAQDGEGPAEGATFNVVGAALDAGWTARASADGDAFNVVGASISVSVAGLLPQPQPQPLCLPPADTATTAAAAAAAVLQLKAPASSWISTRLGDDGMQHAALRRRHTPLTALGALRGGAEFDTVGVLIYASASAAVESGNGCGQWRERRSLFLADEAGSVLLCVRWVRHTDEPRPQIRVGAPICILNGRFESCEWIALPSGAKHLAGGDTGADAGLLLGACEADTLAYHSAVITTNPQRATHLQPAFERLVERAASEVTRRRYAELSSLVSMVVSDRPPGFM